MNTEMSHPTLYTVLAAAILAVAMFVLGATTSDAKTDARGPAAGNSAGASAAPPDLQMDAQALNAEYHSASGEGQFSPSGHLVAGRQ